MPPTPHIQRLRARARLGLGSALTIAAACSSGTATNRVPPTGVLGVVGGGAGGNSGGGGGGSGSVVALYALSTIRGSAPPVRLASDSVSTTDSVSVFRAWVDSSLISLNTDTTATEIDYVAIHEQRTGAAIASPFTDSVVFADTSSGTYIYNAGTGTVAVSLTNVSNNQLTTAATYDFANNALTGKLTYAAYNVFGQLVVRDTATFVYTERGSSLKDALPPGPLHITSRRVVVTRTTAPDLTLGLRVRVPLPRQ